MISSYGYNAASPASPVLTMDPRLSGVSSVTTFPPPPPPAHLQQQPQPAYHQPYDAMMPPPPPPPLTNAAVASIPLFPVDPPYYYGDYAQGAPQQPQPQPQPQPQIQQQVINPYFKPQDQNPPPPPPPPPAPAPPAPPTATAHPTTFYTPIIPQPPRQYFSAPMGYYSEDAAYSVLFLLIGMFCLPFVLLFNCYYWTSPDRTARVWARISFIVFVLYATAIIVVCIILSATDSWGPK